MMRTLPRWIAGLAFVTALGGGAVFAADPPDLADYKTPETAVTARVSRSGPVTSTQPAFLGVHLTADDKGKLTVSEVAADSPAARASLLKGDLLGQVDGKDLARPEALNDLLRTKAPGDALKIAVVRKDKPVEVTAKLGTLSRPLTADTPRAFLGLGVGEAAKEGDGVPITYISAGSPAEKAKIKLGETLLKINDIPITGIDKLRSVLAERKPDDSVTLTLLLAEKAVDLPVRLTAERAGGPRGFGFGFGGGEGRPGGGEARPGGEARSGGGYWKKDKFRLAIVCIEYPDVKHNEKVFVKDWEESMFSTGTYTKTSATGQKVHGSMNDYYIEQSYGTLRIEGKVFEYVVADKKRTEYMQGDKSVLLTEALKKIKERDGNDALNDFDGVAFIYAGGRVANAGRGSLYWPHRASVSFENKRWPYFICAEMSGRNNDVMGNISVYCHEFGHMLGMPDLYARPENPGSEGLSQWCAMSNQAGEGRPQHFCAWAKEKLEWIKPAVIDPTVPQKLILGPIEETKECFKVLVRPDGSEYLLLENRRKKGFDASLPAEGLLIWRVVQNKPILEESHGVEGPAGPRVFSGSVPYPSSANDSFTPFTTPSSRSQLGGGLPVYVTNIRRLDDGRIAFHIGYEYE